MAKSLILRDFIEYKKPMVYSDAIGLVDNIFGSIHSNKYVLRPVIRATHSGYLLNERVYPGTHMQDSVGSWVSIENGGKAAYNKPILTHHNIEEGDPIGRVISAEYK